MHEHDERDDRIDLGHMDVRYNRRSQVLNRRRQGRRDEEILPPVYDEAEEERPGGDKLPLQLFICGAICLAIVGMKHIDLPIADQALDGLKIAVTAQSDVDKALGKLKFVTNLFPDTAQVFSPSVQPVSLPVAGQITQVGQAAPYAVEVIAQGTQVVPSVAAGRVFFAGSSVSYGTMVRVVHAGGYETIYTGLVPSVKVGEEIEAGQTLGVLDDGAAFCFMVYLDGAAVPAGNYLEDLP